MRFSLSADNYRSYSDLACMARWSLFSRRNIILQCAIPKQVPTARPFPPIKYHLIGATPPNSVAS